MEIHKRSNGENGGRNGEAWAAIALTRPAPLARPPKGARWSERTGGRS